MPDLRYAQFCPIARVAEVLGHRWVLLVVRELFAGPQRFVDLRRRLPGISTSVLSERLSGLEDAGLVARRELPPPAASTVYELTPLGRALRPAFVELVRFGARLLAAPRPGDHVEPDWLGLAVDAFARRGPTPARRFELRVRNDEVGREATIRVAGGPEGTRRIADDAPCDVTLSAPVLLVMGLLSRSLPAAALLGRDDVRVSGDAEALAELPNLFEMELAPPVEAGDAGAP